MIKSENFKYREMPNFMYRHLPDENGWVRGILSDKEPNGIMFTDYKIQKYLREKYGAGSMETVRRLIEAKRSF